MTRFSLLFIDLIDGEHDSPKVFRSGIYPYDDNNVFLCIEYTTKEEKRSSDRYEIVVIHAHGYSTRDKTILSNYGEEEIRNGKVPEYYYLQNIIELTSGIKGSYVLILLACNSNSDELCNLLNENCVAVISTQTKIGEDYIGERMVQVRNSLIARIGLHMVNNNFDGIKNIVNLFNGSFTVPNVYKLIYKDSDENIR